MQSGRQTDLGLGLRGRPLNNVTVTHAKEHNSELVHCCLRAAAGGVLSRGHQYSGAQGTTNGKSSAWM